MKKLIIIIIFFALSGAIFAQDVISSAGNSNNISGYEVSWTLGEPLIETLSAGSSVLTQGFHQSKLVITSIDEIPGQINIVSVFPNPTHQFACIKFNKLPEQNIYKLFDLSGRILKSGVITSAETQVDLSRFAEGTYLLKIFRNDSEPIQTFKIIRQ